MFHGKSEFQITLEWKPPLQDRSSAAITDNYTVVISPPPLSPVRNVVFSPAWNATLAYNIPYAVNVTAVNCIGESEPISLNLQFGE